MTSIPNPETGVAGAADAGRSCPYCRFPIKQGAEVAMCGVCRAPHHVECWEENGGCAVVACAGGPGVAAATVAASPAPQLAHPASQPATVGVPWPGPPARQARRAGWIIGASVLVALAAAGGVTAFVLENQKRTEAVTTVVPQTVTRVETQTVEARTAEPAEEVAPAAPFDGASDAQIAQEIATVLYEHHAAVVNHEFRVAWNLLSERKQRQNLVKYGYDTWLRNQATLSPYLDPSGIQVRILELDPATGEATVDVTGMTWSKPRARCTEWSGITWMLYENGQWRYDPGYSTTPPRTAEWEPRFSELLGTTC